MIRKNLAKNCIWGGQHGLITWGVYAVVEFIITTLIPLLTNPQSMIADWSWKLTGILLASYAAAGWIAGCLAGCILGLLVDRQRQISSRSWHAALQAGASLTLVMAFVCNVLGTPSTGGPEYSIAAAGVLLALALLSSIRSERSLQDTAFLSNPWIVSLFLLTVGRLSRQTLEGSPQVIIVVACVGMFAALLLAGKVLNRFVAAGNWWMPLRQAGALAIAGALVFGLVLFCNWQLKASDKPPTAKTPDQSRPNLVMITMDTVRADHLSLYGYSRDTTPNLKKLAGEATLYTHAVAAGDMTLSAHGSLFTGMYPSWHGAHLSPPAHPYGQRLRGGVRTLAEILSGLGYRTMAVVANWAYLQPEFGLIRGFQSVDWRCPLPVLPYKKEYCLRFGIRRLLAQIGSTAEFDMVTRRAARINQDAVQLLHHTVSRQPFFLFLNYMDAHSPYLPPAPFRDFFPGRDPSYTEARYVETDDAVARRTASLSEQEKRHLISQYDGGIAYLDAQIGNLVAQLKSLGLYENTLLVVTADHGEAFGERDLLGHGSSVYQDQVSIPLLIKYPRSAQASVVDEVVSQVDVMPTILSSLGCAIPKGTQGQDLRTLGDLPRAAISESFPDVSMIDRHKRFDRTQRAFLLGRWKLVTSTPGQHELYDMTHDPGERKNLYAEDTRVFRELERDLQEFLQTAPRSLRSAGKLDKDSLERLRSLGYVQ